MHFKRFFLLSQTRQNQVALLHVQNHAIIKIDFNTQQLSDSKKKN